MKKKMSKKFAVSVAAGLLVLSLTACGTKEEKTTMEETTTEATTVRETTTGETTTEETTEVITTEDTVAMEYEYCVKNKIPYNN